MNDDRHKSYQAHASGARGGNQDYESDKRGGLNIKQREYDKALYKLRHLIENALLHLKR